MPEKITYEEALFDKMKKKYSEVIKHLNDADLWSVRDADGTHKGPPHPSPMHDEKKQSTQKVTRPKAEKVAEKNPVGGELKKAPVKNPRRARYAVAMANDELTMEEFEKLFKEKVDPIIEEEEANNEPFAHIDPKEDLEMSPTKAVEVANKLYKDLGYNIIFLHNTSEGVQLIFDLRV